MNMKSRLLAGTSALALIVGMSACDKRDDDADNTVVVVNGDTDSTVPADTHGYHENAPAEQSEVK